MIYFLYDEKTVFGGGQVVLINLIQIMLENEGNQVYLFLNKHHSYIFPDNLSESKNLHLIPILRYISTTKVSLFQKVKIPLTNLGNNLRWLIKSGGSVPKPDFIVFNGIMSLFSYFPFSFIYNQNTKKVLIEHNSDLQKKIIFELILNSTDFIITVSEAIKTMLITQYKSINKTSIITVLNSVAKIEINSISQLKQKDKINIGWIGRLSHEKNPEFIFELIESHPKNKESNVFHLFGSGPLQNKIEFMIKNNSLSDVVLMHGFKDKQTIYATIDLLLITSKTEGLPLVLVEALSSGIPVVSTKVGDIQQYSNNIKSIICYDGVDDFPEIGKGFLNRLNEQIEIERPIIDRIFSYQIFKTKYRNLFQLNE